MAYVPGTILTRKQPIDPPDSEDSIDLSVYNRIEIIGRSPVQRGIRPAEWTGQAGDEYSIKPFEAFGEVIDTPQGALEKDYDVVTIPERPTIQRETLTVLEPGPSPEQQFAAEQSGPKSDHRVETPLAPQDAS